MEIWTTESSLVGDKMFNNDHVKEKNLQIKVRHPDGRNQGGIAHSSCRNNITKYGEKHVSGVVSFLGPISNRAVGGTENKQTKMTFPVAARTTTVHCTVYSFIIEYTDN